MVHHPMYKTSITRTVEKVNVTIMSHYAQPTEAEKTAAAWHAHKERASLMADKLKKLQLWRRAALMKNCAQEVNIQICKDCGTKHLVRAYLCRDRVCPVCAWRLSLRRYAQMLDIINHLRQAYPECGWSLDTLTVKNCKPENLKATLEEMARAWNVIMTKRGTKRVIAGTARSVELTYNKITGEVHPHYHILTMWQGAPSDYLAREWLSTVRLEAAAVAQDHAEIPAWSADAAPPEESGKIGAVAEVFKYAFKPGSLEDMPLSVLKIVLDEMAGRRLVSFTGKIKEEAANSDWEIPERVSEEDEIGALRSACAHCGSRHLSRMVGRWSGAGYHWETI